MLPWGCANEFGSQRLGGETGAGVMTAGTQTSPDNTDEAGGKPRRRFKFPTAFTVLFFVLVLVWILTFIIPPIATVLTAPARCRQRRGRPPCRAEPNGLNCDDQGLPRPGTSVRPGQRAAGD